MNIACCDRVLLASRGPSGALRPWKRGFVEIGPLLCDLLAFRLCYDEL